jgi:SAM-dependent methyltransferase
VSSNPQHDYLERVKAEIRAEADCARERDRVPRAEALAPAQARACDDGIDRECLDYAIGELTDAHYSAFLDLAFRALLKRPPDDVGSETQVRLLAAGASKAEILGNLRWSPEGRRIGTRVRGLLPRYALAKLARVPLLGYFVDWGIALAGLPILLRHQRAADTSVAARFAAATDAQREHDRRLEEFRIGLAALGVEHDRHFEAIGDDIRRALLRLDSLEQRAQALEGRTTTLEQVSATSARELIDQRHHVLTANHWVVSLQRNLAELEDAANAQRARTDQLTATIKEPAAESASRSARHAGWAGELATRLPAASAVLDLGSGDGAWLDALSARGVAARGVETNSVLVARAQARGAQIALGDPLGALTRCADASLGGLVVAAHTLAASDTDIAELLAHAQRALKPEGYLLLRLEQGATRLVGTSSAMLDAAHWAAILRGAGFDAVSELVATSGTALLARRP